MRGKPLCMELYPLLFSSCRIPGPKHDYIAYYRRPRHSPTHITVVRNYQVGGADVTRSESGVGLSPVQSHLCFCRSSLPLFKPSEQQQMCRAQKNYFGKSSFCKIRHFGSSGSKQTQPVEDKANVLVRFYLLS